MIDPAGRPSTQGRRERSSVQVFFTVFFANLAIAVAVGTETWDDGYITLAFARTFAETGHIGLTTV